MKRSVIIAILVFLAIGACVFSAGVAVYRRSPSVSVFEPYRLRVDSWLQDLSRKRNVFFLVADIYLFKNNDKYAFRPYRVLPDHDGDGSLKGYKVYGVVTAWDPVGKILSLNSYAGGTLSVVFNPDANKTLGIFPNLDKYGVIQGMNMQIVSDTGVENWKTLFCPSDIVSVHTDSAKQITESTENNPVIPSRVELSARLCGP